MNEAAQAPVVAELDQFFAGYPESRRLFDALYKVISTIGPADLRVTRGQIAFRRRTAFAWVWIPARHLRGKAAPLVLTLGFRYRHASARWKEIVEPKPGRFTQHLELYSVADIDAEVTGWLQAAWAGAG
jgi:hypothetical protein